MSEVIKLLRNVGMVIGLSTTLLFAPAAAETTRSSEADSATGLRAWMKRWNKLSSEKRGGVFFGSILFLQQDQISKKPVIRRFDAKSFRSHSFLALADGISFDYSLKLNVIPDEGLRQFTFASNPRDLLLLSDADVLILEPAKGTEADAAAAWHVVYRDPTGEISSHRFPAPTTTPRDGQGMMRWLQESLGYAGVVLARLRQGVVIGFLDKPSAKDFQAVALRNTSNKVVLSKSTRNQGASILRLEESFGPYGVFKVVLGNQDIPIGTKVLAEQGALRQP